MDQPGLDLSSEPPRQPPGRRSPAWTDWARLVGVLLILAAFSTTAWLVSQAGRPVIQPATLTPTPEPLPGRTAEPSPNPHASVPLDAPSGLWLPDPDQIPAGLTLQAQNLASTNLDVASQYPSATAVVISQEQVRTGRLTGQYRDYLNTGQCGTTRGIFELTVQAILHASSQGAVAALGLDVQYASVHGIGEIAGMRLMNLQVACKPPIDLRAVSLAFQRANVRAYVDITAIPGSTTDSDLEALAVRLAGIMDARIQSDLR